MEKLWAPWREKYVTVDIKKNKKGILFSALLAQNQDEKNFIVERTKYSFSIMNIYPYNNGHMLILPKRRVDDLSKLSRAEREDLMDLLEATQELIQIAIKPVGYNIGINLGRVAGAGIPQHLHIHIVPRWKGDVNFMPVVAQTKVISQSLRKLYKVFIDAKPRRHRKTRR